MKRILLEVAEKEGDTLVMLYHLPDSSQPYVTWVARKDSPEATFFGRYFDTLEEAEEDFERRSFLYSGKSWNLHRLLYKMGATPEERSEIGRGFV